MNSAVCCAIICVLFVCVNSSGSWKNLTDFELSADTYATHYKWRGPSDSAEFQDADRLTASFSKRSPCKVLSMRDNCFSHNPQRAEDLLHRTLDSGTKPTRLNLPAALNDLKDQVILFAGDSTVVSVYASLVCHLSQGANVSYDLVWLFMQDTILDKENNQDQCPGHPSCHLLHGTSRIASHNITLVYQQLNAYHGKPKETIKDLVFGNNTAFTVVIMNLGIHYNAEKKFMHELLTLSEDFVAYFQRQRAAKSRVAQWHWLETFPQHFPGAGYYVPADQQTALSSVGETGSLHCQAIQNKTFYYEEDWRNRISELFLSDFKRSSRLIPIAEALYDQWDAHVDYGDSLRVKQARPDCTHYCLASGVFRYVLDQILTAVVTCLQGKCKENHFFDGYVEPKPTKPPKPQTYVKRPIQRCSRIPGAALNRNPTGTRQQVVPRGKRDPNCA